jgi:hypothetical protein
MNGKFLLTIAGGAVLLAGLMLPGQDGRQEWSLSHFRGDSVRLSIDRWKPGHHTKVSTDVPVDRFRGLAAAQFDRGGPAKFEYVQDAGRLICEGRFSFGGGRGTFTFVADPNFTGELKSLGYEAPDENQLFQMLLMGVGLEDARTAKESGLNASTQELIDMRAHGVNAQYIRETRRAGYRDLRARDLIEMKNHGVTPGFLRDLKVAGYDIPTAQVVELRNHGVSSEYLRELNDYGLRPEARDLVQMRNHGVTPDYLRGLNEAGYGNLSAGEITNLRNHGVPVEFARDARALGYSFTSRELVDLRNNGVDGRYLRRLHDSGMRNLDAEKIRKLKTHGID